MNEDNKELVRKYAAHLGKYSVKFLMEILNSKGEYETSSLINIILSSHLSVCFEMMKMITRASDNPQIELKVLNFISEFENVLPKMPFIEKVEFSYQNSGE